MHSLLRKTGLLVAGVAAGGLFACQANKPPTNPGALPAAKTEAAPRLNASTYVAHGHLLEQQGDWAQAADRYRQALQLAPDLLVARNRLGITLNRLGRHREASTEFRAALERNPTAAFLHNNLGFSLYLEGNYAEAERALARAVELQPAFRRAQMNHGLALAKLGRDDEALAAFCVAGPRADAYYNLAVLQTEAGRYVDAVRALQEALQLNPEFDDARQQLREVARLAAAAEAAHPVPTTVTDSGPPDVVAVSDAQIVRDQDAAPSQPLWPTAHEEDEGIDALRQLLDEVTGFALSATSLPQARVIAGLFSGIRETLVAKAQSWEAVLRRMAAALGLQHKPY